MGSGPSGAESEPPTVLDLALGQGPLQELDRLRAAVAADPAAALDFAETRQLIERLRGATVVPGAAFPSKLEAVVRLGAERAGRRLPPPPIWSLLVRGLLATAAMFMALSWLDPLGLRRASTIAAIESWLPPIAPWVRPQVAAANPPQPTGRAMPVELDRAFDATQRLAPSSRLTEAWDRYQDAAAATRLSQWLSPCNAVAVMQIDHELRSSVASRLEALAARGQSAAVEDRVQGLAVELAAAMQGDAALRPEETGLALRALLAAGGDHEAAMQAAAAHLRAHLGELQGGALASALLALGELAATTGERDEALQRHGRRLVDEVVAVDAETWSRRRPRLLSPATPAVEVADAGRFLRIAPAFGIDPERAMVVRLLLAAHLQERREPANETPDVPTALVYGFADLLSPAERADLEQCLRTWRPAVLAPDYLALHQLAATREPGRAGYARFQLDLRAICGAATPQRLAARAALCLCLSTSFSAAAGGPALTRH